MTAPTRCVPATWRDMVNPCHHLKFDACLQDVDFLNATSFREQCFYIFSRHPDLSDCDIAPFFGVDHHSISFQRTRFFTPPKRPGRPPLFTDEQAREIVAYIEERLARSEAPTCNDVLNFIYETWEQDVLPDSLRH